jgi:hypothetical protein
MAKSKNKAAKKASPSKKDGKRAASKKTKGSNKSVKKPAAKKKKKGNDLECFLTTACVNYYSLPDNCYELNTLRHYRDTFLVSTPQRKALVKQYYKVAPKIVKLTKKDVDHKRVYQYIYLCITTACSQIEKNNLLAAKKTYTSLVTTLMRRYNLTK